MNKKREMTTISISCERFTIDDNPVCAADFSSKSGEEPMICEFLEQVGEFGKYHCGFISEFIPSDDLIYPLHECPIWKDFGRRE